MRGKKEVSVGISFGVFAIIITYDNHPPYRNDDFVPSLRTGTGEMKLLKNPESGRVRVLMRREQVHKVVCNHLIAGEMKLTPLSTSESAVCWYANDFSEGSEPKREQLACR